jgi:hypothetical protein
MVSASVVPFYFNQMFVCFLHEIPTSQSKKKAMGLTHGHKEVMFVISAYTSSKRWAAPLLDSLLLAHVSFYCREDAHLSSKHSLSCLYKKTQDAISVNVFHALI